MLQWSYSLTIAKFLSRSYRAVYICRPGPELIMIMGLVGGQFAAHHQGYQENVL